MDIAGLIIDDYYLRMKILFNKDHHQAGMSNCVGASRVRMQGRICMLWHYEWDFYHPGGSARIKREESDEGHQENIKKTVEGKHKLNEEV